MYACNRNDIFTVRTSLASSLGTNSTSLVMSIQLNYKPLNHFYCFKDEHILFKYYEGIYIRGKA